ncbi:hypothetical protein F441_18466 [Phytophthora nicotianae CJ01A1]|uniref:Uncharacterized protein n=6 Tax=Phytophthora nicotianae TaxID=4792 RepID=W3A4H2_PHYNI|nr:hypothetical protein PPTG_13159 [Phytophthora nicotianae INRA-310]ETI42356.1 hypothetical protein F443_12503 [Phytophthora nicotianae P1569]ETK82391.1 hypothetical protein L915_12213 [Phytophthora nicotianae]ETO70986.1 hypothetical protein F444_12593 [Phytophthora nicotianae P1976]ETP04833.1 hypothetical protein F441_18466 [Phytophthora nicotianae CJ01A1]ETP40214.1 hypothetical protein F442_12414 [Phytophthora nicotianae P10297]
MRKPAQAFIRKATKDAGDIAGLNVPRTFSESTIAVIAYGQDKKDGESKVLVFDLSGRTFNESLLPIEAGIFEVKATDRNTHLGDEDFDKTGGALRERVKAPQAYIEVDSLFVGIDFNLTIMFTHFEAMCGYYFRKTMDPVESFATPSCSSARCTRSPAVGLLQQEGVHQVDQIDGAVTYGATVQAAILSRNDSSEKP